ncbi:MAG TPA: hypothetical protein VMR62_15925 [Bryobacteraceae bacterium]|nr:hypothetical protein [Bryobacteraceae bacterium]
MDAGSGRYRIARILNGQNEEDFHRSRSPKSTAKTSSTKDDIYKFLRHAGDAPVILTYKPLSSESNLLYLAWVEQKRKRVDELSHGCIGYMHLPDMGEKRHPRIHQVVLSAAS